MKTYPITPVPKPRMTQRDKWAKRPSVLRYRAFCDEVRLRHVSVEEHGTQVTFVLPMPKSWSKKKRKEMNDKPHKQTPDLDNLCKALLDAIFTDDSHISSIVLFKVWGETGGIRICQL